MTRSQGFLLFAAAAAGLGVTAYVVSQVQKAPATPATTVPPAGTPADVLSPVSLTSVTLATASPQTASVPRGGVLEIYPPDSTSKLVSYTIAGGMNTPQPVSSPSGPISLNANGGSSISVLWEDAQSNPHTTVLNVTVT